MNNFMNYYELLGVKNNATADEIKSAYKTQMKKWHPDINKSADAINMSTKINEAKEVLLDDIKRSDYNDYLTKKTEDTYNRYTQKKATNNNQQNNQYQSDTVTKWQYLKQWLKFANASKSRKIIGLVGVLLESLLCAIIKYILIFIAYISNVGSYFIRMLFAYMAPVIGIFAFLFVAQLMQSGFSETFNNLENSSVKSIITIIIIFISSLLLPIFSKIIISPKVFDILYNKIDINLFKKCVDYKD